MANHLSLNPKTISVSLVLIGLVLYLPFSTVTGGDTINCLNPPVNNPNSCHIFTWRNFPVDTGFQPLGPDGMFNNDTSYYFGLNATGVTGFNLCMNVFNNQVEGGNISITLQFQNLTDNNWWNVAQNGAKTAGSFGIFGGVNTPFGCSQHLGVFPSNLITICFNPGDDEGGGGSGPGMCLFRIAGNTPQTQGGAGGSLQMSELTINFYTFNQLLQGTLLCSVTSAPSLTSFTNTCRKTFISATSQSVSVYWQATNTTGSGCGTSDNCWRFGTLTCTIPAGSTTCLNALQSFSPAFTTNNGRAWDGAWSTNNGGTQTLSPLFIKTLLP